MFFIVLFQQKEYLNSYLESIDYLLEQERKSALVFVRDRVRFIRLLKSGEAKIQSAADQVIGLCERQSQPLWRIYQILIKNMEILNNFCLYNPQVDKKLF